MAPKRPSKDQHNKQIHSWTDTFLSSWMSPEKKSILISNLKPKQMKETGFGSKLKLSI